MFEDKSRFVFVVLAAVLGAGATFLAVAVSPWFWIAAVPLDAILVVGIWDLRQVHHSLMRNYPVVAHLRWMFEGIRPEIRQYLIEGDETTQPFNREQRSLVYARAKNEESAKAFGSRVDINADGYAWLMHAIVLKPVPDPDFRVRVGGPDCARPYDASLYNISAMSFGSLGANAILALNKGARIGNFAHDTGEGGICEFHRTHGGDLIWEIGSGYFGCRNGEGKFDPERFREQASADQVRMVEIKLSQGAKAGHGGILPAAKITPEIARARGIPMGVDCVSPSAHPAFSTPREMMDFIARLRELSGGKAFGFKLCVGHRWEFLALVKAMRETGVVPDFIVVDGKEGGTGAGPLEFVNHIGTPLSEGLSFVANSLIGAGLRDRVRIGASGKIISAFDIAFAMSLGADWCNSARGFMFALGCVQAERCHTNLCPVGVATQDPSRQRALVVGDKATRVANFHRNTLHSLAEVVAAAGLDSPQHFNLHHIMLRQKNGEVLTAAQAYPPIEPGALLEGTDHPLFREHWKLAQVDSFAPAV